MLLVLLSAALNTTGQVLLKQGSGQGLLNPHLIGGLGMYCISTVFYIAILGKTNLSFVYPLILGLTITATTLSSLFLLDEKVPLLQWFGIGLIIAGISAIAAAQR